MNFRWFEYGLLGALFGFLSQDIMGSFCVVHTFTGSVTYHGFTGCMNAVFQKTALSLIFVGVPLAVLSAISGLFKNYWLKGGIFTLVLGIAASLFFNFGTLVQYLMLYFIFFVVGTGLGFIYGKLFEKEEEIGIIKWTETH